MNYVFGHSGISLRISYLLLVFFLICFGVESKTILVGKSTKSDFNRIQTAINVAKHGDTIVVASGRYHESILIKKKNINIRHLDMGGGLGVTYDREQPPQPSDYVTALAER